MTITLADIVKDLRTNEELRFESRGQHIACTFTIWRVTVRAVSVQGEFDRGDIGRFGELVIVKSLVDAIGDAREKAEQKGAGR